MVTSRDETRRILARFLPRFAELARERVERALALAARAEFGAIVSELHALAGEATLLGLNRIAELAREGEETARKGDSRTECERVLHALATHVASVHHCAS
jgi:HPt (histidine-containing phosphotransfer) domain-containing protein